LPKGKLDLSGKVQYIGVNAKGSTPIFERLKLGVKGLKGVFMPDGSSASFSNDLISGLKNYDLNIVSIHGLSNYPRGSYYGLEKNQFDFIEKAAGRSNVAILLNGNLYLMKKLCGARTVLVSYEDDATTQNATADVLLGTYPLKGQLGAAPCSDWTLGREPAPPKTKIIHVSTTDKLSANTEKKK